MDYEQAITLLEKYHEGETTIKEEEALHAYFHGAKDLPEDLLYAKNMFDAFKQEAKLTAERPKAKNNLFYWVSGVAASLLLLIGMLWLANKTSVEQITKHNKKSEPKEIRLGDKANVWLNAGAVIRYSKNDVGVNRKIELRGEAFFEFGKDAQIKYEIHAENALVLAESNSAFNIDAVKDSVHINVTVQKGAVKVMEEDHASGLALLVPEGNYCSVHKEHKMVFMSVNQNENYLAWKTGELIFNNKPMANVAEVLEAYYGVQINIENKELAYCEFSGKYQDKSVNYILQAIQNDLAVECFMKGDVINISGDKCHEQ